MIALVTDSSSQLSAEQANDADITVVPITIIIDGTEHLEGVDLAALEFYESIGDGVELSTSQPSPGQFVQTYEALIADGATEIVSLHLSEAASGTLNSARLASELVEVPVHLIDSKMTSYGLGVLALAAAEHVRERGTDGLVETIEQLIPDITTTFILQDLKYVLRGGRIHQPELPTGVNDIPVLSGSGGGYGMTGQARSIKDLVGLMADALLAGDHQRHVAIAVAAPDTVVFTEALEEQMHASKLVESVVRYQMGPSIAVYTGPGTAGGFSWPA